jgi:hypothetical protein
MHDITESAHSTKTCSLFVIDFFFIFLLKIVITSAEIEQQTDKSTFIVGNIIPREVDKYPFLRGGSYVGKQTLPPCRGRKRLECSGCNSIVVCCL